VVKNAIPLPSREDLQKRLSKDRRHHNKRLSPQEAMQDFKNKKGENLKRVSPSMESVSYEFLSRA
jgi:hypothetical protein